MQTKTFQGYDVSTLRDVLEHCAEHGHREHAANARNLLTRYFPAEPTPAQKPETVYSLWQANGCVVEMSDHGDMQGANGKTCAQNFIDHVLHWLNIEPRADYRIEVLKLDD